MVKKTAAGIFFFLLILLSYPSSVEAAVLINEFSPRTTNAWVELMNTSSTTNQSLTGWTIQNGGGTTLKSLSGTLPRQGFLTFEFASSLLGGDGDCLLLADATDQTIYRVAYGTSGNCPGLGEPALSGIPSANQSGALISNSWTTDDTPSRGWCNDATGGCPTIATIVSSINANGVKTNLGDQSDFSRISGLYFQKSVDTNPDGTPLGKITFLSEMNFTDQDALSWMQTMDSNIDMSTRGKIGLNAELIRNLTNTNASLTMYGLSYNNPTVSVTNTDGSAGDAGIVSSLTYAGGNLTFTAAHFTTFTASENTSTPHKSSAGQILGCFSSAPGYSPNLFQIDTTSTNAKLYFTPVNDNISYYYFAYGLTDKAEDYGTTFDKTRYEGVIDYTINLLSPNTTYYFKVRGGNGCAAGPWSNVLMAKTEGGGYQSSQTIVDNKTSANDEELTEETPAPSKPKSFEKKEEIRRTPANVQAQPTPNKSFWQKIKEFFSNLFGE